ncbi:hypothetical protein [Streptomyces sp. DASNCL29]|uniref:hypothetical protein n=1 Tax=Streptomyces sp. DASNCL29 TaxID=2583819 RepID=UPI001485CB67|nr:hypothetical protein [Streptomyces sp. DASNCL29]
MAWPDLRVEIQAGGVWTDVTADTFTRRQQVTITRGRADEAARADPARCQLGLNNKDGKYSPRNPMSPYYGLIGRNTPLRVSVAGSTPRLVLDGSMSGTVDTPDAAALDIVGDLDLRAEAELDWTASGVNQVLIGKWDGASGQRSYALRILDQRIWLNWSVDGITALTMSASAPVPTLPDRAAIRATLDVDNGVGGWTVSFSWARSITGPWTQIGSPVTGTGVTSIYAGTAPLRVGSPDPTNTPPRVPFAGSGYRFEVRSGIDGTLVASPDFTTLTPGTTSFVDEVGHTWMLQGTAEISDRLTRFVGEVSSWPSRWGVAGQDVWVPIEAAGILRRLGQGAKALDSTLRRRIPTDPNLLAYWPMEEDRDATQAYSPIAGVAPMPATGVEFASDDSLPGSSPLPKIGTASRLSGQVPRGPDGTWRVEYVYKLSDYPTTPTMLAEVRTTGTYNRIQLEIRPDNLRVYGVSSSGDSSSTTQLFTLGPTDNFTGNWNRLQLWAEQSGGSTTFGIHWVTIGGIGLGLDSTLSGITAGHVTGISSAPGTGLDQRDLYMGHLSVFSTKLASVYDFADHGFTAETAGARMRRLSQEEGVPVTLAGAAEDTLGMGPQRPDTLLNLLSQAADTDGGTLGEQRDRLALRYRVRTSLYSQPPALELDYQGPGLAPPLDPQDDDADVRNDITITRIGGSSARAVLEEGPLSTAPPPAGVGVYDESVSLSLADDDQAEPIAWWRLWLGTQDEIRYPSVRVDLTKAPGLADAAAAVVEGDRITIANPPAWLPPETIDLLVQGYSETFLPYRWDIVFNCTPARPWNVAHTDAPQFGRVATDGTQLATGVDADDTTLSLAVDGTLWTTNPADCPLDVRIGGEIMTVARITGAVQDRFDRTITGGWGTTDTGETWTLTGGSNSDYSVQGA